jgi:uncharacterized protein with GYD domain
MNTYIVLFRLTDEGRKTMHESVARAERAKPLIKRVGARIKDYYMTTGAYDFVVVFEAPNDEAIVTFLLSVGSWGGIRHEMLRAFTRPEYNRIMRSFAALNRKEALRRPARKSARRRRR